MCHVILIYFSENNLNIVGYVGKAVLSKVRLGIFFLVSHTITFDKNSVTRIEIKCPYFWLNMRFSCLHVDISNVIRIFVIFLDADLTKTEITYFYMTCDLILLEGEGTFKVRKYYFHLYPILKKWYL